MPNLQRHAVADEHNISIVVNKIIDIFAITVQFEFKTGSFIIVVIIDNAVQFFFFCKLQLAMGSMDMAKLLQIKPWG